MATATKTWEYEALDARGKRSKGKVDATTEAAAASALQAQGVLPLAITRSGTGLNREITIPGFGNRVTLKDLSIFARQFATMTNSGLSLLRSLAILEEQTAKPKLAEAVKQVRRDIQAGSSLSAAMSKQDTIFPTLMIAMVRAGETGGFLDGALTGIADNLEKDGNLRAKIKSAMTYPTIVVCFSILMITGVLIFIVPIFEKMFSQLGAKLQLPTRIMVAVSHEAFWLVPLLVVVGAIATRFVRGRLRNDYRWRRAWDTGKLRLPVFGMLFTKIAISRFARNLGTLLSVGVPVMQALDIVGATTGNALIGEAMKDVQDAVRNGQPMSTPLTDNPLFPLMVTNMIEVGEETGQISAMLDKIADFYDREVDQAAEQLTAAIEPIMVVLMGGLVGGMVVCLYLPMFSIYQHIQGANG